MAFKIPLIKTKSLSNDYFKGLPTLGGMMLKIRMKLAKEALG